ncbi:hypothetical protein ABBQ38_015423 [Trebouxia sp. C0009 RCD-2024]
MALEAPVIGKQLTLLSAWFCPFAQRTWIALNEKGVPYTLHEVAIKNPKTGLWHQIDEKPGWFLKLNPLGKVPTLAYKEADVTHSVYESNICDEFLEDYQSAPPLFASHPVRKAQERTIIDHFSSKFVPLFYRVLVRQDKEQQTEVAKEIQEQLHWLEDRVDSKGPYFMGKEFSMVDVALLPWFIRLFILEHYRGFGLPAECQRLAAWQQRASKRQSVVDTCTGSEESKAIYHEQLLQHYSRYADASANSTSAHDFK